MSAPRPTRPFWLYLIGGAFLIVIVGLFASSLLRPEVQSFAPSTPAGMPAPGAFVFDTVTIDARDGSDWVFFSFERGALVDGRRDPGWDIAIQRFHLVANGGSGYPGEAGAMVFSAEWDSVTNAPADGYEVTEGTLDDQPVNAALERWYDYSFLAHTLDPTPDTYVIRTANRHYAKMQVISYYCPGASPGCFTFRYAYQGDGSRRLAPDE